MDTQREAAHAQAGTLFRLGRYSGNIRAIDRMEKMLRKMLDVTV